MKNDWLLPTNNYKENHCFTILLNLYVIIFFEKQRYLHLQIFMELKLYQSVILAFSLCIFTLMYICSSLFFVHMLWSNYWYTHKHLNMLSQLFFALSYTKYAKHIVNTCSVILNSIKRFIETSIAINACYTLRTSRTTTFRRKDCCLTFRTSSSFVDDLSTSFIVG